MDLFVILFFLIVSLVQWLSQRKGDPEEPVPPDFPESERSQMDPPAKPPESPDGWRELMEALGRSTQEPPPPPRSDLPPVPPASPQPAAPRAGTTLPNRRTQTDPLALATARRQAEAAEQRAREERLRQMQAEAERLEEEARALIRRTAAESRRGVREGGPAARNEAAFSGLGRRLRDQALLRDAIVLNELLQKPVAMRDHEAHQWL